MALSFDETTFRAQFTEFATTPDSATLSINWDVAAVYISTESNACTMLSDTARSLALNLLTAHITKLGVMIAAGKRPAVLTQASIDKVSVTTTPPPVASQFDWWLSTTAYGSQLLALLSTATAGGCYFPGGDVAERSGFRTAGGGFGGRSWPR